MPALVQICIVTVTIGLLAIALAAVIMVARFFRKATEDISELTLAVRESVAQVDLVAREARVLVASLRNCVPPMQRVVDRFEAIAQRTADLSSTVLKEVERPVFSAAALTRGVRAGADQLRRRLMQRFTHRNASLNGDQDNE